ncbi:hypothetical protein CDAR_494541 [Caerostris darwini]|uniref:Uncharacterized protein n=1 Tax=Caerostris darwini TaxID=1538125 RepID=A0AAV4S590_9ARAC|nr:hypothetical protein CDAR_494541 [Caerostris darwini]
MNVSPQTNMRNLISDITSRSNLRIHFIQPSSKPILLNNAYSFIQNLATDIHWTLFKSPKYARLIKVSDTQESDCCDAPETTQPILRSNSCLSDFSTRKIREQFSRPS